MYLLLLPTEIIINILKYCSYISLSNLNQTCKTLKEISNLEVIWSFFCCKDYGVKDKGDAFSSFSELYKNFLCRYGHMLGTYMLDIHDYGGLAEVDFQNGLTVWQWKQIHHLPTKPLMKLAIFKIKREADHNEVKVICCKSGESHEAKLVNQRSRRLVLQCNNHGWHLREDELNEHILYEIFFNSSIVNGLELLPVKMPHPLDVPSFLLTNNGTLPPSLIEAGLFRGVFNAVEDNFVIFSYRWDGTLFGFRVATADFASVKKSLKITLKRPFCPTLEQQSSFETLMAIPDEMNVNIQPKDLSEHDFNILPIFGIREDLKPVLRRCKARFHGFGKVHGNGFQKLHFIVFSNDRIGILWLEMRRLKIFERVTRKFTEKRGNHARFVNT